MASLRRALRLRPTGRGLTVGTKIILPFALLSLVVGAITSGAVSRQLGASAAARQDALAIHEEDAVGANFDSFEQRQLTDLRALTGTQGVPQAIEKKNLGALGALLYPAIANQLPDQLSAAVIDRGANGILSLRANPANAAQCVCQTNVTASWPHLSDVLLGISDTEGPKFAGLTGSGRATMLYTIGPVLDRSKVVGAIVVAEPVSALLESVRKQNSFDVSLYDPNGTLLAATTGFPVAKGTLATADREQVLASTGTRTSAVLRRVGGTGSDEMFFVPVQVRGAVVAYAAVLVSGSIVGDASQSLPPLLLGIFVAALSLTLITGLFVARMINRPLGQLLRATDEVSAGNLAYRAAVSSSDEIGRLARHFNRMTQTLEEKSQQLEASTEETVQALASAIDARDAYTHGHSVRVSQYSVELARALGVQESEIEAIRRGCLVHDIGKIGVPDHILGKPGPLTADEEGEMRLHPITGYGMLRRLNSYQDVLDMVLHHHERWDGTGYPHQLAGEEIPVRARLVAVADTLDAMTSRRPYRTAFTFARAAREIEKGAGSQFDPVMVEAFKQARVRLQKMVERHASDDRRGEAARARMKLAS